MTRATPITTDSTRFDLDRSAPATDRRITAAIAASAFLAMIPVTMLVPALKEAVGERFGASPFWTHSFMSVNMIGAVMAAPWIAMWSDRAGQRKRVAVLALAVDAVCLALMHLVQSTGLLWLLLSIRFVEGAAHILAISAIMAIAAGWAPPGRRGRTMGLVGACMMFGTAMGTRVGGAIWKYADDSLFLIAALTTLLTATWMMLFVSESAAPGRARASIRDAIRLVGGRLRLLVPMAYAAIDRLCVGIVITTLVLFLADVHSLEPNERSRLLLAFLLPFAMLVYPAGRLVDRIGRVWPIALGSCCFGLVFAGYGFVPTRHLVWLMLASGVFSALMFAPNLALCADLAPADRRGTAFAGFNAAGSLGFLMGPLLGGGLFAILSARMATEAAYQWTFVAAGATEVLCAVITLPFLLALRREGAVR